MKPLGMGPGHQHVQQGWKMRNMEMGMGRETQGAADGCTGEALGQPRKFSNDSHLKSM